MMFLQYWPLGLWNVTVGTFIAANTGGQGERLFDPGFLGHTMLAAAVGSLVAPAVFGWVADRHLAAQRVLVGLHLLAAASVWGLHGAASQTAFAVALVLYFQFYIPTVTLTNTIALRQLPDVDRGFFVVRLFGTVGWVSSGLFVGFVCARWYGGSIEATRTPLMLAAVSHVAMAAYCLTLPHTPPETRAARADRPRRPAGESLWRNRPFLVFLAVSFLACIPSQAYNVANLFLNERGYRGAAGQLTIGQVTEVACMIGMPLLLVRFGLKRLFLIGVLGWGVRYALLAFGALGEAGSAYSLLVYLSIFIHGPCYVFVYVAGQLYIDRLVPRRDRGAAQGWHAVATTGLGHLVGALVVGWGQIAFLTPSGEGALGEGAPVYRWFEFWMLPVGISLAAGVIFAFWFTDKTRTGTPDAGAPAAGLHATDLPPSPADALTEPPVPS